jgi:hypothetical protein
MYTITITRTNAVKKKVGKDWAVIAQVPFTDSLPVTAPLKPVYGYTPAIEKDVEQTVEVLKQTVDDLDLIAVIQAINNIA